MVQSSSRFEDQHDIISGNKRYTGDVGSAVHGETGKNERNYYSDGNNMVASETDGYYDGIERLEGYAAEECEEVTGDYKSKKEHVRVVTPRREMSEIIIETRAVYCSFDGPGRFWKRKLIPRTCCPWTKLRNA